MQADGYIPPGEYSIQYFIDVGVSNPIDFPDVKEDSKYLLMRVLPRVNISDPGREIAALVSGGIALLDPEQPAYSQLTNGGDPVGPTWSPNGSIIGYFSHLSDGIHLMFADGSADIQIAKSSYDLTWSPDNTRLAVDTFGPAIWAANPDGSAGVFLAEGERPQWSPVAAEIAFLRNGELWWMKADGTSQRKLAGDVNFGLRIPGRKRGQGLCLVT